MQPVPGKIKKPSTDTATILIMHATVWPI